MSEVIEPTIDSFIRDYATSPIVKSLEEWGTQYGVSRWTVAKWIKEYASFIEEIHSESTTEFNNNLQRTRDKALKVVDEALDKKDIDTALKMMPFYTAKKEHIQLNANIDKVDEWIVQLDKVNVSGGN